MATEKFKESSPYINQLPPPPPEDYVYNQYLEDIVMRVKDNSVVKVALFGVGRIGAIHLASIATNPRVKLLYIVDDVGINWPNMENYWRLDDNIIFLHSKTSDILFEDEQLDAIVIASPTCTHEVIINKALHAGKAVFCEKPLTKDAATTINLYNVARNVRKELFCGFNRRFDQSFLNVRTSVRNGEVGHVHMIKTVSRDSPLPSLVYLNGSGGIFYDCLIHDIDMIIWILGEYPIQVFAHAHANIPEIKALKDFDTVAVTLYFASGTIGMIDLSRCSSYGYDQRLEVFGPKGMVQVDNEGPLPAVRKNYNTNETTSSPIWYSFPSRYLAAYRKEFDHFIDVVLKKSECSVTAKEVIAATKITLACETSVRTNNPVNLNWTSEELPPRH